MVNATVYRYDRPSSGGRYLNDSQESLSPYGTASIQMQDTTAYVAVPIELVRTLGLGQGTKVQRAYDSGTDCLVVSLRDDHDLFAEHR